MRNNYHLLFTILNVLLLSACGIRNVSISLIQPGAITLPPELRSVALVNRALPANVKANIIEAVLTDENLGQDKNGRQQVLSGVLDLLRNSPRLNCKLTTLEMQGWGTGTDFPAPLDWSQIQQICNEYQTDGVVALETFDTDCIITNAEAVDVKKTDKDGKEKVVKEFRVKETVVVKLGFRIYDLKNRQISDQHNDVYTMYWSAKGSNPMDALANLLDKRNAINQTCYNAGLNYGKRITPLRTFILREYYKRGGNSEMQRASRMVELNDWNGAAFVWKSLLSSGKRKTAGRSAFNLAVANEVGGDLEAAKDWARKAYTEFNIKRAQNYEYLINQRLREEELLKKQMSQ